MACLFALFATACNLHNPEPTTQSATSASALRLVSLSPAISRTLIDLNLADRIVGRTPYCESIDQSIPVVGDLTNVNFEMLTRLNPTHILVQPPIAGVDPHLRRVADEHGWIIGAWHLDGISDIRTMLRDLPGQVYVNDAPAREARRDLEATCTRLIREIDASIAPAAGAQNDLFNGRVLMVNDVSPVMAFGSGTYLDDILRSLGGTNAVTDRGWVQLSLEDVVRLAPEAIILVKPGANAANLTRDLGPLASLDAPAVRDGRVAPLAHRDAMAPSSGVIGVAGDMKAILRSLSHAQ